MEKNWKFKKEGNPSDVKHLMKVLNVGKILAELLVQRGIRSYEAAQAFFRPQLSQLHDPFLMKDMDKAIDRIVSALDNKEIVMIYGDYDVDGTTSVAMAFSFFRDYFPGLLYYVPDRYLEGYGISYKGIDFAAERNVTLIIALDCGIKAVEKIAYAKNKGVEFIICDHHFPGETIPEAVAVLDPKRLDCFYPFKELCGCGVGFKLIQAFCLRKSIPNEILEQYLDLLAVSIASDIVPIIDENRVLAYYGLKKLNINPCPGLKSIIILASLENKTITVDDVVFKIGPRINAAGRIESGNKAVELLASDDPAIATRIGDIIDAFNNTRKNIDSTITCEALNLVASDPMVKERYSTVLYDPGWHKGVIGIVASRLIESYYRPTIVLTESNGLISGSARSIEGFDLYQAIDACSDLLENFGGHTFAAGITLKHENLEAFREKFEKVVFESISKDQVKPSLLIDTQIELKEITPNFFDVLKQFQPFGPENINPVFLTKNVNDIGTGKKVGKELEHLKLDLIQEEDPFRVYTAIGFQLSKHYEDICKGNPFDVCYTLDENDFRGQKSIQLRIKDIK